MFILTINEPHWLEPIIQKVSSVKEEITYRRSTGARRAYIIKDHLLIITHSHIPFEVERFRLNRNMTHTVELDPDYVPVSV